MTSKTALRSVRVLTSTLKRALFAVAFLCGPALAVAQTPANLAALKGLVPVSSLPVTPQGQAALAANLAVTGGIQTGAIPQSTPLPFAAQQQQALQDAFITDGNLANLADGLGTTLGAAYTARAHYLDRGHYTSASRAVADLIAYTNSVTAADARSGKFFFANETTNGKNPVSDEAMVIMTGHGGVPDPFGRSYGRPAGSAGADEFGNSRPFQTEPRVVPIEGPDYFNAPANNTVYNRGPVMNLVNSPSYPSGHTTYGYTGAVLLALLVPERYCQMIARGAEYGNDRILMGAHYAMDVLAGRALALHDVAHLLANDPLYVRRSLKDAAAPATDVGHAPDLAISVEDYRAAVAAARSELTAVLQAGCGDTISACARADIGRFSDSSVNEASYAATQTYGLPVVYAERAGELEDVGQLTPEAGYLLTVAFPNLTLEQANRILTETEGPGGGFLDDGSSFGVYSRLNLYAAAERAAVLVPR